MKKFSKVKISSNTEHWNPKFITLKDVHPYKYLILKTGKNPAIHVNGRKKIAGIW